MIFREDNTMFCKNCGSALDPNASVCIHCGVPSGQGNQYCANCGNQLQPGAVVCMNCGFSAQQKPVAGPGSKSKLTAALLGFFLGGFGAHNFYLGYQGKAIAQLSIAIASIVLTTITCGILFPLCFISSTWALVESIMILAGSINTDANGNPLGD